MLIREIDDISLEIIRERQEEKAKEVIKKAIDLGYEIKDDAATNVMLMLEEVERAKDSHDLLIWSADALKFLSMVIDNPVDVTEYAVEEYKDREAFVKEFYDKDIYVIDAEKALRMFREAREHIKEVAEYRERCKEGKFVAQEDYADLVDYDLLLFDYYGEAPEVDDTADDAVEEVTDDNNKTTDVTVTTVEEDKTMLENEVAKTMAEKVREAYDCMEIEFDLREDVLNDVDLTKVAYDGANNKEEFVAYGLDRGYDIGEILTAASELTQYEHTIWEDDGPNTWWDYGSDSYDVDAVIRDTVNDQYAMDILYVPNEASKSMTELIAGGDRVADIERPALFYQRMEKSLEFIRRMQDISRYPEIPDFELLIREILDLRTTDFMWRANHNLQDVSYTVENAYAIGLMNNILAEDIYDAIQFVNNCGIYELGDKDFYGRRIIEAIDGAEEFCIDHVMDWYWAREWDREWSDEWQKNNAAIFAAGEWERLARELKTAVGRAKDVIIDRMRELYDCTEYHRCDALI